MQILLLSHDYHATALHKLGTSAVEVVPLTCAIKAAALSVCTTVGWLFFESMGRKPTWEELGEESHILTTNLAIRANLGAVQ